MRLHPFTSTFLVYVLPFSKFAWDSISISISENSKPRSIFLLFICRGWIEREKKLFRKICSRLQNNQKTTHSWLISGEPAEKSMVSGSNLTILAMISGGCRQHCVILSLFDNLSGIHIVVIIFQVEKQKNCVRICSKIVFH